MKFNFLINRLISPSNEEIEYKKLNNLIKQLKKEGNEIELINYDFQIKTSILTYTCNGFTKEFPDNCLGYKAIQEWLIKKTRDISLDFDEDYNFD